MKKFLFYFYASFIFLTLLPDILSYIPLDLLFEENIIAEKYNEFWSFLVGNFAKVFLKKTDVEYFISGSGDKTYDYINALFISIISLIVASIVFFAKIKEGIHKKISYSFYAIAKLYLTLDMFSYGFAKVFKTQFPNLYYSSLITPLGDKSPMGLAWDFMGYSYGYNLFTGLVEVLGGLLLVTQKTTRLGALILAGTMFNVFMMNMCYDIPVKLYSFELFTICLYLILIDKNNFLNFLIFNKNAEKFNFQNPFKHKKTLRAIKYIIVSYFLIYEVWSGINSEKEIETYLPKRSLNGLYNVQSFVKNNDTLDFSTKDTIVWKSFIIEWDSYMPIIKMNDYNDYTMFEIDSINKYITCHAYNDSINIDTLKYIQTDTTLYLDGVFRNDTIKVFATKKLKKDFLLMKRGFNWINEEPFNR